VPSSSLAGNERMHLEPTRFPRGVGGHDTPPENHVAWWEPDQGLPVLPTVGEDAGFTLTRVAVLDVLAAGIVNTLRLAPSQAWALLAVVTMWAMIPAARMLCVAAGAGLTWLIGTGFVTHRHGDLSFTPADQAHLIVLAVAAIVVLLVNHAARGGGQRRYPPGE
jgi:hypothetical protein